MRDNVANQTERVHSQECSRPGLTCQQAKKPGRLRSELQKFVAMFRLAQCKHKTWKKNIKRACVRGKMIKVQSNAHKVD